jgi:hypothetical protein
MKYTKEELEEELEELESGDYGFFIDWLSWKENSKDTPDWIEYLRHDLDILRCWCGCGIHNVRCDFILTDLILDEFFKMKVSIIGKQLEIDTNSMEFVKDKHSHDMSKEEEIEDLLEDFNQNAHCYITAGVIDLLEKEKKLNVS